MDRAVIVETLVEGLEIDFALMILVEIHERALNTSITYLFFVLSFISAVTEEWQSVFVVHSVD